MELLDLSARNRLLNVLRFSAAARTVKVVGEKSPKIFRMLVNEGRTFTFVAGCEGRLDSDAIDADDGRAELPQPEPDDPVDGHGVAARHSGYQAAEAYDHQRPAEPLFVARNALH